MNCKKAIWPLVLGFMSVVSLAQGADRFSVIENGTQMKDNTTGLIWRRCFEGQQLSGEICSGTPTGFTHKDALVMAQSESGWRLPNIKELASILNLGGASPSIRTNGIEYDILYTWSSTPASFDSTLAFYADLGPRPYDVLTIGSGETPLFVRLVR
jgi:hypothetical protein